MGVQKTCEDVHNVPWVEHRYKPSRVYLPDDLGTLSKLFVRDISTFPKDRSLKSGGNNVDVADVCRPEDGVRSCHKCQCSGAWPGLHESPHQCQCSSLRGLTNAATRLYAPATRFEDRAVHLEPGVRAIQGVLGHRQRWDRLGLFAYRASLPKHSVTQVVRQ